MHPTHWLISTQVAANWPRGENITEWKRLVVYQKCVVHRNEAGKLVAGAGNLHGGQGRALDFDVTGPNLTLAPSDVRAACRATVGANQPVVSNAVEALDIRVVHMIEPGRARRASTDEAGAVLHYLSEYYDDLNDATFFAHGHVHGELGPFMHTLRYARLRRTVPAAFAATTRYKALRDTANAWVRDVLNVSEADFGKKRGGDDLRGNQISGAPRHRRDAVSVAASARWRGVFRPSTRRCCRDRVGSMAWRFTIQPNSLVDFHTGAYRNGEFIVPRLVAHKRTRTFYQAALSSIVRDARCQAAAALRETGGVLPPPFERYLENLTGCDWRLYRVNRGGHLIEGWWPQLFCEACFTPSRRDDPRLPYD